MSHWISLSNIQNRILESVIKLKKKKRKIGRRIGEKQVILHFETINVQSF